MEIPVLSRISGFEAEINRLQNPSLISRYFHLSAIEETIKIQSFWTWGALIIALIATFTSFISRLKLVVYRFQRGNSVITQPLLQQLYDDEEYEDETCSSCSSSYSSDDEDESTSAYESRYDEDFTVAGNYEETQGHNSKFKLTRRNSCSFDNFSWSDFVNGKSVVKSWDGLGLGLNFEKASESLISLWDLNKNEITSSFSSGMCQIPALSMPSPAVIVAAGLETSRNVALQVFDTRVGRQIPQIFAEWQPRRKFEKLYIQNDVSVNNRAVVVRDIRKVDLLLENLTESDVNTWWDSDAVIVDGNQQVCYSGNGCGSVVTRCRNAVFSYLF
ncbi:hypothetical protein IFM89_004082 [Coptis chinensis]|uniref:Uncharacterized protein n=1 Tax=Coptis chinensis TaxID=261450 RepID=A0A835LGB0_9MAGN|nr:hypothetical protein IFM89_004082 [Coptis chinensis]